MIWKSYLIGLMVEFVNIDMNTVFIAKHLVNLARFFKVELHQITTDDTGIQLPLFVVGPQLVYSLLIANGLIDFYPIVQSPVNGRMKHSIISKDISFTCTCVKIKNQLSMDLTVYGKSNIRSLLHPLQADISQNRFVFYNIKNQNFGVGRMY